jgi:hypothetical protein
LRRSRFVDHAGSALLKRIRYPITAFIVTGCDGQKVNKQRTRCSQFSLLLRHNLILDLVVRRLRDDLLLHQLVLAFVRPPHNDLLGVLVADAWQGFQFWASCRINTDLCGLNGPGNRRRQDGPL